MKQAGDFARAAGCRLRAVTVEPEVSNEPRHLASVLPIARSERLSQALDRIRIEDPEVYNAWDSPNRPGDPSILAVRRGEPVAEILDEVRSSGTYLLAVGFHRGGPPGLVDHRSVGRRLLHGARCAVLTVPL